MWIHLPTSVGLPGTGASTWDSDSCSQALAASVTASGNLRPANLWQRVLRKGLLTTRLSGLTCDPFQATCIVARWILQFSAHRASPTAWPESNSEKMTNGTCGPTSSEWWEKYDHQQSFLRTSPSSSDTSGQLEIDYKKWATKLRSRCSLQRKKLERRIYGNGSSLWPTARREDGESCGNHPGATDSLRGAIELWKSPRTISGGGESAERKQELGRTISGGEDLQSQVELWSTPNTPNGGRSVDAETVANRGNTENGKRQVGLESEVRHWQSPGAGTPNSLRGSCQSAADRASGGHQVNLQDQVGDWRADSPQGPETSQPGGESLLIAPTSRQHYPVSTSGILLYDSLVYQNSSRCAKAKGWYGERPRPFARKRLNPLFVNSLMNWPCYWTLQEPIAYGAQATASYLYAQRWEYERLCKERGL